MADPHRADELALLRAELATVRARLARVERRRRPRRLVPLALVALLVALLPLSLLAAGPFADLDPAQVGPGGHNPNIQAIADAGITRGCNPPDNTAYCPKDYVTREQMATFLARTAGLGGNAPVANAATLQGYAPDDLRHLAVAGTLGDIPVPSSAPLVALQAVTVTTPRAARVRLTFGGTAIMPAIATACPCVVEGGLRQGDGPFLALSGAVLQPGPRGDAAALAGIYVFAVPPGTHTFTFAARGGPDANLVVRAPNLHAELFPVAP